MQEDKPILIVGLGNPGAKYLITRHNIGFLALDNISGGVDGWRAEKDCLTKSVLINGKKVIFAKPQTYMNNSGVPVLSLMTFYKIPLENLIVIHDDMDLPVGDVREKIGGGSAGHNGIKSLDLNVGRDYTRIRIGIGHPRNLDLKIDPADWVLGKFTSEELKLLDKVISDIRFCPVSSK